MKIESGNAALSDLRNAPKVGGGQSSASTQAPKTLGETPPIIVPPEFLGELEDLFAPGGMVSKLRRRLNRLKNRKCRVVPAKGTIACIDSEDLVYLGVEFLNEFRDREDVIAGVMAHEWGHSCAVRPDEEELQKLNWEEIFELRRAHETLADEISGRLLALMGYDSEGLVTFLLRTGKDTHNLKYHDPQTRASIIRNGHADEKRKIDLANQLFPKTTYANNYHSKLIDDEI